ncbi:YdcH family protein [Parvularcula marina]|uniref:DUF465 domain-containing protein n=1 Tax=Parvularcula marina TaxID=2292771 RepID=A0A371REN7_9PROT|nr:YdcH family protein [Parvularcula marina]RFB03890.1 DUF465 domain-containing protein [Parvularcula marina]
MNIDARLTSLDERHRSLETLIEEEMRRPMQDELRLHDLKRQKLAIKDEMFSLETMRKPN